jgi:formylglycine-generating enzyme required for sulfatase activity
LGWASICKNHDTSLSSLCRRKAKDKAETDRWKTTLQPGGWVEYAFYFIEHKGDWKTGLEKVFREKYLFDLEAFDNELFCRADLGWIKKQYLMLLQFAWDDTWYDHSNQTSRFRSTFGEFDSLTGGWDVYTLWPTWPRLGLDSRNQFDMYRDLPGGIEELREQTRWIHKKGKHYFIAYNPWDESTRKQDHLKGLADLLKLTDADGVVLDTRGKSSRELQEMADSVRKGIIMYSEGMAVPGDMPGIISGRVHNALYMPPVLNLNKFIKPDFAIFRVIDLGEDHIHREIGISFFNGYGVEINTMRPGRPAWIDEEFSFLGKTTRILRENTSAFNDLHWSPLIETAIDNVWVNHWQDGNKDIYTIFSLRPEGVSAGLFETEQQDRKHYIDILNHEICKISDKAGKRYVVTEIDAFKESWLGTRKEGTVGCIAGFEINLSAEILNNQLEIDVISGDEIRVWQGNPSYSGHPLILPATSQRIDFDRYNRKRDDKIVIQLFRKTELIDEVILNIKPAQPVLISSGKPAQPDKMEDPPPGMCWIPGGDYHWFAYRDSAVSDVFIPFPDYKPDNLLHMKGFYIDKYPVTNREFGNFIKSSGYMPADTHNYLRHWKEGIIPDGLENHPVVNISLQDAEAYAKWSGKRLPSECEWQYAAQGNSGWRFPWGDEKDSTFCNYLIGHTTEVTAYPKGISASGVMDLVGNVWQLTADRYYNGSYYYSILKGGSYYSPESSIWYVKGGVLPVSHHEMLLHISPSIDRCSTIGFRCVRDIP